MSSRVCVLNKTEDLNLHAFDMISGINESKVLNINHANVNVYLILKNATRIKSGVTINVGVSTKIQKNIIFVKKIIFGILLHAVVTVVYM